MSHNKSVKVICRNCNQLKLHEAHGLCQKCYRKEYEKKRIPRKCKKCRKLKKIEAYDMCKSCYMKQWRKEHPNYDKNRYHTFRDKTHITKRRHKKYLVYNGGSYVHRTIAEKVLGRKLKRSEVVHHINGDSLDNRNSNLLICNEGYHTMLHGLMRNNKDKEVWEEG